MQNILFTNKCVPFTENHSILAIFFIFQSLDATMGLGEETTLT